MTSRFRITGQGPRSRSFFLLVFLSPASLEEGHFSQQVIEPRDINVAHKHPNIVTRWLVPKLR